MLLLAILLDKPPCEAGFAPNHSFIDIAYYLQRKIVGFFLSLSISPLQQRFNLIDVIYYHIDSLYLTSSENRRSIDSDQVYMHFSS
ncbi:hypothetical protein Vpro01_00194 [Vibrio proteolyticus]